jgi:threonine dehydrogenase-like Zn-dependent dehydrogenase
MAPDDPQDARLAPNGIPMNEMKPVATGEAEYGAESIKVLKGLDAVRKRGKVSLMGLPGGKVEIDFEKISYKELVVSGGIGQRRTAWLRALKLMERGTIDNGKLISHQLALRDWNRGFEMMERQEGLKVLLRPH